jgi:hypothetical protein
MSTGVIMTDNKRAGAPIAFPSSVGFSVLSREDRTRILLWDMKIALFFSH